MNKIKRIKENVFIFLCFIFFIPTGLISQNIDSSMSFLGIKCGYANTYSDSKIREHPSFDIFYEIPVFSRLYLKIQAEYFETNRHGLWYILEHQGTLYSALTPFVWQSSSLGLGIVYPIYHEIRVGAGASINLITVKELKYTKENPFIIDENEHVILQYKQEYNLTILRSGVCAMADYNLRLFKNLFLVAELQYKYGFIGKKFLVTKINTTTTYTIYTGLKYSF
jgi:hypothetical protein